MRPEWIALTINAGATFYYVYHWQGSGKFLYWLGATIITIGLINLKG